MFVVDTNVLLHAANRRSTLYRRCDELIASWRSDGIPFYVTWPICYEFLRVATHSDVLPSPFTNQEALDFLNVMFDEEIRALSPTNRHSSVLAAVFREMPQLAGSIMHDLHVAVLMREHGFRRIFTFDTDFHRFPFLEVIDPLKP